ncbi:MAG TPA: ATP-binding protein [Myxococcaceae bacterium]|nr:ATP-binding protein [Myxococcaceae bacterium]
MAAPRQLRLSFDSRLENVALAGRALHGIAHEVGLSVAACDGLELCVVEAVTNSIVHAYGGAPEHEVRLHVTVSDEVLEVQVIDRGTPMAPGRLERAEPAVLQKPALLAESGRGLLLMRQLMDGLEYTTDASGNTLKMTLRLGPKLTAPA